MPGLAWLEVHGQCRRGKHVTLQLLHLAREHGLSARARCPGWRGYVIDLAGRHGSAGTRTHRCCGADQPRSTPSHAWRRTSSRRWTWLANWHNVLTRLCCGMAASRAAHTGRAGHCMSSIDDCAGRCCGWRSRAARVVGCIVESRTGREAAASCAPTSPEQTARRWPVAVRRSPPQLGRRPRRTENSARWCSGRWLDRKVSDSARKHSRARESCPCATRSALLRQPACHALLGAHPPRTQRHTSSQLTRAHPVPLTRAHPVLASLEWRSVGLDVRYVQAQPITARTASRRRWSSGSGNKRLMENARNVASLRSSRSPQRLASMCPWP
jgi:hypothetical protein